jgi:ribosomal protein L11 methyltransferase
MELAPDFAHALSPKGAVVLAGMLETQADAVIGAYEELGLTPIDRGSGEWPVLVCKRPA